MTSSLGDYEVCHLNNTDREVTETVCLVARVHLVQHSATTVHCSAVQCDCSTVYQPDCFIMEATQRFCSTLPYKCDLCSFIMFSYRSTDLSRSLVIRIKASKRIRSIKCTVNYSRTRTSLLTSSMGLGKSNLNGEETIFLGANVPVFALWNAIWDRARATVMVR